MKNGIGLGVIALAGVITGCAVADVTIEFAAELAAGESVDVALAGLVGTLTGVNVTFDYDEPIADASWASDVQMILSDGDSTFTVGGFTNAGIADAPWIFDGSGSTDPGTYSDSFVDADWAVLNTIGDGGSLDLAWVNDWGTDPNPNMYDVTIVLKGLDVPAPGALALLGLAGIAPRRRRRG